VVAEDVRGVTIGDWIVAFVAVCALALSIYNTYMQRRDRTPRVEMVVSWNYPSDAAMAWRGTAAPGEALYQCEITNVGIAGVKIRGVNMYILAPPGKPIPLHLTEGEQPRKLDNGDSQTWVTSFPYPDAIAGPSEGASGPRVRVVAWDTVGNRYEAKNPPHIPHPW
jgi:hypothetical protein